MFAYVGACCRNHAAAQGRYKNSTMKAAGSRRGLHRLLLEGAVGSRHLSRVREQVVFMPDWKSDMRRFLPRLS